MRFGIRPQAALLAVVPLVFLSALLAIGSLLADRTKQANVVTAHTAEMLAQSQRIIETISATNAALQDYAKTKAPRDVRLLAAYRTSMTNQTRTFRTTVGTDPRLAPAAASYVHYAEAGMGIMVSYMTALHNGQTAEAARLAAAPSTRQMGVELEHSQVVFDDAVQAEMLQRLESRRQSLGELEQWLVICALFGIVLTVGVALFFSMRIVVRLQNLGENARRLAAGTRAEPDGGNDEIGSLDRIYREMAERIQSAARAHAAALDELRNEREVATVLQQALLPEIPSIRGLRLDTAYATPAEGTRIGGDWFDVFVLSERYVGMSVGDVAGHGVRAAAFMGFVRQSLRIVATLDTAPNNVIERVNRIVCEDGKDVILTAFFGIYDRQTGTLTYSLAGHCPPLVLSVDGSLSMLEGDGVLIGIDGTQRFTSHERLLEPGDVLVLYTDGIVEAERDYLKGVRDLESAIVAELAQPSANRAEGIQRRIFRDNEPLDDSALLVFSVGELISAGELTSRVWHFDARDSSTTGRVKYELLQALAALGPLAPDRDAAEIVFGELLSNVVRHTPGTAFVRYEIDGGRVRLTVEDRGKPYRLNGLAAPTATRPDNDAESGRGMFLISAVAEGLEIQPTVTGKATTVYLPGAATHESWG